jgi:hypothetical protein
MRTTVGHLRRLLLSEIDASMASRLIGTMSFVAGPGYEGGRVITALDTAQLEAGRIVVLGTVNYTKMNDVPLADGSTVEPYMIDAMFGSNPAAAVGLIELTLAVCGIIIPSRSVSPAAQKFVKGYYRKNMNDESLIKPLDAVKIKADGFLGHVINVNEPWACSAYYDTGHVNAQLVLKRTGKLLSSVAKNKGISREQLYNEIHDQQHKAFDHAYNSKASGRCPSAELALSGGEPTLEKIKAALRNNQVDALKDFIRRLEKPLEPELHVWLSNDHNVDMIEYSDPLGAEYVRTYLVNTE